MVYFPYTMIFCLNEFENNPTHFINIDTYVERDLIIQIQRENFIKTKLHLLFLLPPFTSKCNWIY